MIHLKTARWGLAPEWSFWGGSLEMCLRSDLVSGYFLDVILESILGDGSWFQSGAIGVDGGDAGTQDIGNSLIVADSKPDKRQYT